TAAAASGQKNGFLPTSSQSQSARSIFSLPICTSAPRIVTAGIAFRAIAPAIVSDAVFRVIGVVGVAGAVFVPDVAVILGTLVHVVDEDADRRSGRHLPARIVVYHHPGEDARLIRFATLGGEARRSRPAAVEFGLDVGRLQRNPRWAAVDDAAYPRPMALAERGDAKEMAEAVVRHFAYIRGHASRRQSTSGQVNS